MSPTPSTWTPCRRCQFAGSVLWPLPGVRETRTYAVTEEVKSSGKLPLAL
jgi:Lrp/AsnC family leucine-responsive transcriptional regulator